MARVRLDVALTHAVREGLGGERLPGHVAIIMDGNRRWARRRMLPSIEGHRRGIVSLREITRACSDFGIGALTVYGFSTENWNRDRNEISLLFDLCVYFARSELAELHRNDVRVNVIGRIAELPPRSREALETLMTQTASNERLLLNLAVNYSARTELRDAVAALARDVEAGRLAVESIDDARIASYLYTAGVPDPDLLIRTSGESRLSNFLLYQVAHTELYVTDACWPDFGRAAFVKALESFQSRRRSYGGA